MGERNCESGMKQDASGSRRRSSGASISREVPRVNSVHQGDTWLA